MDKLLFICGPTSTGKTSIALKLANKFNGELISADSRQIYKGLDIGTGKDIPKNTKFFMVDQELDVKDDKYTYGYYDVDGIPIWLLDLVRPDQNFTVAHYLEVAHKTVKIIKEKKHLPIFVGGTGLYISSFINPPETIDIPPDINLRRHLSNKNIKELTDVLIDIDKSKWLIMNYSDKNNPRRLQRAIEIGYYKKRNINKPGLPLFKSDNMLIGLNYANNRLKDRINKRVDERIKQGIQKEITKLVTAGYSWDMQSMQTLGYKEWQSYFDHKTSLNCTIDLWKKNEYKYAKRQITWFTKMKDIIWFNTENKEYVIDIVEMIGKWYTKE